MDQPQPIRTRDNLPQRRENLAVVLGRKDTDDRSHGPSHTEALMRAPDGADDGAAHHVRVVFAEDVSARVLVDRVAGAEVADEGGAEERRDVGVVHAVCCVCQSPPTTHCKGRSSTHLSRNHPLRKHIPVHRPDRSQYRAW